MSDGTSEGTVRVNDIDAGLSGSNPSFYTHINDTTMLFAATMSPFGRELWRTDGTRLGTKLVTDLRRGFASSNPTYLLNVNGGSSRACLFLFLCRALLACCVCCVVSWRGCVLTPAPTRACCGLLFVQEAFTSLPLTASSAASSGCPTGCCWTT